MWRKAVKNTHSEKLVRLLPSIVADITELKGNITSWLQFVEILREHGADMCAIEVDVSEYFNSSAAQVAMGMLSNLLVSGVHQCSAKSFNTILETALDIAPALVSAQRHLAASYQSKLVTSLTKILSSLMDGKKLGSESQRFSTNSTRLGTVCVDQLFHHSLPRYISAEDVFSYLAKLAYTLGAAEARARRAVKSEGNLTSVLRLISRVVIHQLTVVDSSVVASSNGSSDARSQYLDLLTVIVHNQRLLLSPHFNDSEFLSCLAHKIHRLLLDDQQEFREAALNIMKLLIQTKRDLMEQLLKFKTARGETVNLLVNGFDLLESKGYNEFVNWVSDEENLPKVRMVFDDSMGKTYRSVITGELKISNENERILLSRRETRMMRFEKKNEVEGERYYTLQMSIVNAVMALQEFEQKSYYKWRQEERDRHSGLRIEWARRLKRITRERAIWGPLIGGEHDRWMLDPMEGPFRMRAKLMKHSRFFLKFAPHLLRLGHRGPWYKEEKEAEKESLMPVIRSDSKKVSWKDKDGEEEKEGSFHAVLTRMATGHSLQYNSASSSDLLKLAANARRHLDKAKMEASEAGDELEEEEDDEKGVENEESQKEENVTTDPISKPPEKSPVDSEGSDTDDESSESSRMPPSTVSRSKWWSATAGLESPSSKVKKHHLTRQGTGSAFFAERAVARSRHARSRSHTATQIQPGRILPITDSTEPSQSKGEKGSPLLEPRLRRHRSITASPTLEEVKSIEHLDVKKSPSSDDSGMDSPRVAASELNRALREESEVSQASGDVITVQKKEKNEAGSPIPAEAEDGGVGSDYDVVEDDEMMFIEEDPARAKIMRIIFPEEEVIDAVNCSLVAGMDKIDGILVLCPMNLYVIDHFRVDDEGNVAESDPNERGSEANFDWSTSAETRDNVGGENGTNSLQRLDDGPEDEARSFLIVGHPHRKWDYKEIREIHKRRYLLRPVGIELFSTDGRSMLLVFDMTRRNRIFSKLLSMNMPNALFTVKQLASVMPPATPGPHSLSAGTADHGARLALVRKGLTRQWQEGKISNFQYLMHLNTLAGRSYKDLTQYPVFPWVLADYTSEKLDLTQPDAFRDLSKPMGALSEKRAEQFRERFEAWDDPVTPSFHYATHYSTAAIVLHYLIRLEPFTSHSLSLQSGRFDHPDRLFTSVRQAYRSASQENMSDVRELIPEFFYLPEFLRNRSEFEFGFRQTGENVTDVGLPPWAENSPHVFIRKHRQALESEYVSSHLHEWIDLIFGYKQQGPEAIENLNVFHYLTYEGAVDVDDIDDPVIKAATIAQINNFGQTPKRLFTKPHPKRHATTPSLGIYSNPELLAPTPVKEVDGSVGQIVVYHHNVYAVGKNEMLLPPSYSKYISFMHHDRSLHIHSLDSGRILSVHGGMHAGPVTAACISENGRVLVTGSSDNTVRVWAHYKFQRQRIFAPGDVLCGHTDTITCLEMCHNYSILVSGSKDKTCIVWDLARQRYVRSLIGHDHEISAICVNELSGEIVTCALDQLRLWSVNGDLLAVTSTGHMPVDKICSCTVSLGPVWLDNHVVVTGHADGSMRFNSYTANSRKNSEEEEAEENYLPFEFKLRHILPAHDSSVTSLVIGPEHKRVYSGCSNGSVICWSVQESKGGELVLRQIGSNAKSVSDARAHWQPDDEALSCSKCNRKFTFVERRHHCRLCGKVMCNRCCGYKMELIELQYYHPVRVCESCFIAKRRIDAAVQMI